MTGICTAVWLLARQAYVAAVVPFRLRARAMSTLGGVYRIGLFVGPFVGGAVVASPDRGAPTRCTSWRPSSRPGSSRWSAI